MFNAQNRVLKHNTRSAEAHDPCRLFAHLGLIAVDSALGAHGLLLSEGAAGKALSGVLIKRFTLFAQPLFRAVMRVAVVGDHEADRVGFLFKRAFLKTLHTVVGHV